MTSPNSEKAILARTYAGKKTVARPSKILSSDLVQDCEGEAGPRNQFSSPFTSLVALCSPPLVAYHKAHGGQVLALIPLLRPLGYMYAVGLSSFRIREPYRFE